MRVFVVIKDSEITGDTTVEGVFATLRSAEDYTFSRVTCGVEFFIEEMPVQG